jgi:peroxin-7
VRTFQTPDSTYDVCFNEANANQILSAGGDGSLKLWDVTSQNQAPLVAVKGHQGEVFGCEWNHINKRMILSASFDKTIALWDASTLAQGPK